MAEVDLSGPVIGDTNVIDVALDDNGPISFLYQIDAVTYGVQTGVNGGQWSQKAFTSQVTSGD